jgi:hypothetical protein
MENKLSLTFLDLLFASTIQLPFLFLSLLDFKELKHVNILIAFRRQQYNLSNSIYSESQQIPESITLKLTSVVFTAMNIGILFF